MFIQCIFWGFFVVGMETHLIKFFVHLVPDNTVKINIAIALCAVRHLYIYFICLIGLMVVCFFLIQEGRRGEAMVIAFVYRINLIA